MKSWDTAAGGIEIAPRTDSETHACASPEAQARRAATGLLASHPELSAGAPTWLWQRVALLVLVSLMLTTTAMAPGTALSVLLAFLALPFLCVVILRSVALAICLRSDDGPRPAVGQVQDADLRLPSYSVLVPLFREAHVVPGLVAALAALDYPADRLEIFFILESIDAETRRAFATSRLPPHMHIVVVPDGTPRTKPRALNYALQGATGEIVVIYDAEDIPHPQQLRAAARALQAPGHRIGCVQARLGVYNPHASWLTRQFTIEYAALFGALLPALARLDLPLPLGGTSNHFWRSVLEDVGAWDAYNVTEDADLGIRLARFGYEVHVLDSTTGEEAPTTFSSWLKQRTRWLKGWMQTYLVHMRQPRRLRRELGTLRFAGLQILMGGMVLATLVHPWFYVLIAAGAWSGSSFIQSGCVVGAVVWWIGIINFLAGYSSAVALGGVSVRRVGHAELAVHALWMPLYWLAISLAAYRALWQLVTAPFLWEKTEHAARPAAPLVQTGIALRQVPIYRRPRA